MGTVTDTRTAIQCWDILRREQGSGFSMRTFKSQLSILFSLNRKWLGQSNVGIGMRLAYYLSVVLALTRDFITGEKEVRFLGHSFAYDNRMSLGYNLLNLDLC